jgi:hypothetical protein
MTSLQIANGKQHLNGRYPIDPELIHEDQRELLTGKVSRYEPDLFFRYVIDHDHDLIIARRTVWTIFATSITTIMGLFAVIQAYHPSLNLLPHSLVVGVLAAAFGAVLSKMNVWVLLPVSVLLVGAGILSVWGLVWDSIVAVVCVGVGYLGGAFIEAQLD